MTTFKSSPRRILAAAFVVSLCSTPGVAQIGSQLSKFIAPVPGVGDEFGYDVAVEGTTVVVGAWYDDDDGIDSGAVFVFDVNTGTLRTKLTASDAAAGDEFGKSVAISGTIIAVGAPMEDGNGPNRQNRGAVYLFDLATGTQLEKLTASDAAAGDGFGHTVDLSGSTVIVGAPGHDDNGSNSGAAYLFNASNGNQIAKLLPGDGSQSAYFGFSVGISGTTAIVSAMRYDGFDPGSAYLFDATTGAEITKIVPEDLAAGDQFGISVGISGSVAIVGAYKADGNASVSGAAYLFDATSGTQLDKLISSDGATGDGFGWSVAIDGNTAIVGVPVASGLDRDPPSGSRTGAAYLFDASTGVELAKLRADDSGGSKWQDELGTSVAISGVHAVAGAPRDSDNGDQSGSAYLFSADNDSDGDGLYDSWETLGIPYTGVGGTQQRFTLPGADPMYKDLYVEVDAMTGFPLHADAVEMVEFAFEAAPLDNPNGFDGVRLHILRDETDLPHVALWQTDGCWPLDYDTYRGNSFGTVAERTVPAGAALLEAKALAYRYCISADDAAPNTIGGCAKSIPGDDFVIFVDGYDIESQAAVFMHELGHCLGLRHGGGDDINGKPNYPSIMNYAMSYRYAWNTGFWKLDFSRADAGALGYLDESSLDETVGIGTSGGLYSNYTMPYGVSEPDGSGGVLRRVRYVRLDGSPTDFGDTDGTMFQDGSFDTGVAQDLNYAVTLPQGVDLPQSASPDQALAPFDDWGNVILPLVAAMGDSAPALAPAPTDELTDDAIAWIDSNFPPPPATCAPDLNSDGVLDNGDIGLFVTLFIAGDPGADFTGDGILDNGDIGAFVAAYLAGC